MAPGVRIESIPEFVGGGVGVYVLLSWVRMGAPRREGLLSFSNSRRIGCIAIERIRKNVWKLLGTTA